MIVQVTQMCAPAGQQKLLKQLVETQYVPSFQERPGFLGAEIEVSDEGDDISVLLFWSQREDVELMEREGVLAGSAMRLAAHMPGVRVRQHGYMVGAAVSSLT